MFKQIAFLLTILLIISSCGKKFNKLESGLEYCIIDTKKNGINAKPGDILNLNMLYKTESDTVLFNSKAISDSFRLILKKPQYSGDINEGLALMQPGDSAQFKIDAEKFYNESLKQSLPHYIKPGSKIIFEVRLIKITHLKEYEKELSLAKKKKRDEETTLVNNYVIDHNLKGEFLPRGTFFSIIKEGKGRSANAENIVDVLYTGSFLDGTVFDKRLDVQNPFRCKVGSNGLVDGWNEALQRMKEGGKVVVVLPSNSAYGEKGYGPIPPYTPIVFEIELLKVLK